VLDGVACAVSLAESLVRIGLKTSKRNSYVPPLAKTYAGEFKRFAPH
jgi:allantoin racemase